MPNIRPGTTFQRHLPCLICGVDLFGSTEWTFRPSKYITNRGYYHLSCAALIKPAPALTAPVPIPTPAPTPLQTLIQNTKVQLQAEYLPSDITDKIGLNGHKQTRQLQALLRARCYPFLFGAPGAGKTHIVMQVARDMELDFELFTCSLDSVKSHLVGSVSPLSQVYLGTKFRSIWATGGVILFDECALADGSFLNLLNAALEQKIISFPDGHTIPMHEHCFIVFADNSNGWGMDSRFPERRDIGSALRNRLTYLEWSYDEVLEQSVVRNRLTGSAITGNSTTFTSWQIKNKTTERADKIFHAMQSIRRNLINTDSPVTATPRASFRFAQLLFAVDSGVFTMIELAAMLICEGLNGDLAKQAKDEINRMFS